MPHRSKSPRMRSSNLRIAQQVRAPPLFLLRSSVISSGFGSSAFLICSSCSSSSFKQHVPEIAADDFFLHAEFFARLLDEHRALPRRVQVERVHVEAALAAQIRARHQHVHFQQFVLSVFPEAAHAVAAVSLRDDDFVAFDLRWALRWSALRRRAAARTAQASSRVRTGSAAKGRTVSLPHCGLDGFGDFFFSRWLRDFSSAAGSVFSSMAGCSSITGSLTATVGRWPLPSHAALFKQHAQALRRGLSP